MKELKNILLLIMALTITPILVIVGILWNTGKGVFHVLKLKWWTALWKFIIYWFLILYQIYVVVGYIAWHLAISLDLLWNVLAGEFIEDCITSEEDTLFGKGNVTVSESTGELENDGNLNKSGRGFSKFLDFIMIEKNHSTNAYKRGVIRRNLTK